MRDSKISQKRSGFRQAQMKRRWVLRSIGAISLFFVSGCSVISHLEQLLTLKDVSNEQRSIGEYVAEKDVRFQQLLETVCSGGMNRYATRDQIMDAFGRPVLERSAVEGSVAAESWLYHRQTRYFHGPKVVLNFDESGSFVSYDVSDCSSVSPKK